MQILFLLFIIPLMLFIPPIPGTENPVRNGVVIMSVMVMANPFTVWIYWYMRLRRLGYESLRPRTRPEFVRELGLAFLWDLTQCWLGGILLMGIASAIWAPELLQAQNIVLFVICTAVGQLCAYAMYAMMGIWIMKHLKRGMLASIACAFCPFVAMASWIPFVGTEGAFGFEENLAIVSVLAAAGLATIAFAYHRWCRADLE
jgi:hypothetical protein